MSPERAAVLCDIVTFKVVFHRFELLYIQQEDLVNDVLVICLLISISNRTNVGVVGKVGSRLVDIDRSILRVGHDGALRHRLDRADLVLTKAAEETLFLVIRRCTRQDVIRVRRIAAEPIDRSSLGIEIEPGAHIAVPPMVGAVLAPPTVVPMRACLGIRTGRGIIGHGILKHLV